MFATSSFHNSVNVSEHSPVAGGLKEKCRPILA